MALGTDTVVERVNSRVPWVPSPKPAPVERLDLPPVRVAILAVVVVYQRDRKPVVVVLWLDLDAGDVGLPQVQVRRSGLRPGFSVRRLPVAPCWCPSVRAPVPAGPVVQTAGDRCRGHPRARRDEQPPASHRSPSSTFAAVRIGSHVVLNGGAYARS